MYVEKGEESVHGRKMNYYTKISYVKCSYFKTIK